MNMHWCTGKLNLSGQGFTIVHYEKGDPISWPEAQVLMALHGDENIFDLKPCAISDTTPRTEKERLLIKYGQIVEKVFPGYSPRMEMAMPGESEDQPHHGNGNPNPGPSPDDDEEEGDDAKGLDPPAGPAVFGPGKVQPPRKGA